MYERYKKIALPAMLISVVLTALTLIFPQIGFLEWITLIPLFLGAFIYCADEQRTLWRTYWGGFLTVFVYYFVIYHWFLSLYPLDFIGMDNVSSVVVVIAGWVGLSVLQAIPGGLIFLIFKILQRGGVFERTPILRPIVFSALWIVFEWSSTLGWTGVPWGRLCIGQSECLPALQSASLFGSYFVSFLVLIVNGLLAYAIIHYRTRIQAVFCVALAVVILCSNILLGYGMMNKKDEDRVTVKVAAIQGNVDMDAKGGATKELMRVYGEMTREAVADGAEIVVWPESIFPYRMNHYTILEEFVCNLAAECNVTLIVGALYGGEDGKSYNTLYMITPDGQISDTLYHKRHLVPFGEYVPMRELFMTLIPPLAEIAVLDDDITPGTETALFETEWGKLGGLICFDSIYEELTRASAKDGANLMLLPSNDSWWFSTSVETYQNETQAMLRAIESGRYLVRAGNTGISSIITEHGEHKAWLAPETKGIAISDVEMCTQTTLYTRIGNSFVYLCMAFVLLLYPVDFIMHKYKKDIERRTNICRNGVPKIGNLN